MAIEKVKFAAENGDSILITIDGEEYRTQVGEALLQYGLQDWLAKKNKIEPYYTIISAEYANPDNKGPVRIKTKEGGNVIARENRPFIWSLLQDWLDAGGVITDYVDYGKEEREAAAAEAAKQEKRKQLLDAMLEKGITPEQIKKLP